MPHLFYPHPHSLHLFLLLLFSFFITLPAQSNNNNNNISNPNCPSYICGDVNIRYPFWKIGSEYTTQFCGYEGFGINCSYDGHQNISHITFNDHSYHVQNINHDLRSIILVDNDVSSVPPVPNNCPRVRHGINLQNLPLYFTMFSVNLSFHFNCTGSPPFATEIPCLGRFRNERRSFVHIVNNSTAVETEWNEYSCDDQEVVTTVFGDQASMSRNLSMEFGRLLRGGFELEWRRTDDCEKCEESGGWCGYHSLTTRFICFCSDGTSTRDDCKGLQCECLLPQPAAGELNERNEQHSPELTFNQLNPELLEDPDVVKSLYENEEKD